MQETARADDAEGENCVTPAVEGEDCNGKEAGLASAGSEDIGDHLDNMTSEGPSS